MFTGIVEEIATLSAVAPRREGLDLTLRVARAWEGVKIGDSVAVDGVCLTIVAAEPGLLSATAAAETLLRTTLAEARPGRRVHVERALRVGDPLGGHFVQGHVDGVARVAARREERGSPLLSIAAADALERYIVPQGSIAVDGVSLTVNRAEAGAFEVLLVPHTVAQTTLGERRAGDRVNLEVDILAKVVEHLLARRGTKPAEGRGVTLDLLADAGFCEKG